jgi:phosphatidylethanolamine-binding protein (PEBP) family uncharacterized protein
MRYTCAGADTSIPVQWSGIPAGTAELAVFVISFKPIRRRLFFDWAVTGLAPTVAGIAARGLPQGAVVGRNGFGSAAYSICPWRGRREAYIVRVLALSQRLAVKPGASAGALYAKAERLAKVVGFTVATYRRP